MTYSEREREFTFAKNAVVQKWHHFTQMLYHCFASFKQSSLDFFKLVDSQLVLILLYDYKSYNQWSSPITSGHLGS